MGLYYAVKKDKSDVYLQRNYAFYSAKSLVCVNAFNCSNRLWKDS